MRKHVLERAVEATLKGSSRVFQHLELQAQASTLLRAREKQHKRKSAETTQLVDEFEHAREVATKPKKKEKHAEQRTPSSSESSVSASSARDDCVSAHQRSVSALRPFVQRSCRR